MAIEESSVVAAACTAKFWSNLGGFKTKVLGVEKIGQVHFLQWLSIKTENFFKEIRKNIIKGLKSITSNMEKEGGVLIVWS